MLKSISSKIFFLLFVLIFSSQNLFPDSPLAKKGERGMVVSAEPIATKVGLTILKKGGNAVDAAVATAFALAVTYPVAGNIGGGGFIVLHLANGTNTSIDFREKAPLSAFRDMYLDSLGNFVEALSQEGETSSGVPGSVAGLLYTLEKYGTMKLTDVIQPAINLAEIGFPLSESNARSFKGYQPIFKKYPSSWKVFTKNGEAYLEGEIFKQPDLAKTLKLIRDKGRDGFYTGEVADLIVAQMKNSGGYISHQDLINYQAAERNVIEGSYHDYKIVSMPPPSSGGIALVELLNILENFSFDKYDWNSSKHIHALVESMKYVYADRAQHLGDSDFFPVPIDKLISKSYAKEIFDMIGDKAKPSSEISAGDFSALQESEETTHFSIYDQFGNAVSMTTTINSGYGSGVVVEGAGFLLNNEMDDFSAKPGTPNQFGLLGGEANAIVPNKRMLSSMTPTIILKNNEPFLVLGSPGGSTIITVVLQVALNCMEFEMDLQAAVNAPRIHHQWFPDEIFYEPYGLNNDVIDNLKTAGHKFGNLRRLGLVEAIMIDKKKNVIWGATDPRGSGLAEGF